MLTIMLEILVFICAGGAFIHWIFEGWRSRVLWGCAIAAVCVQLLVTYGTYPYEFH